MPTHQHDGCLDLVIAEMTAAQLQWTRSFKQFAYHGLLTYSILFLHTCPVMKEVTVRVWKSLKRLAYSTVACVSYQQKMTFHAQRCSTYESTLGSIIIIACDAIISIPGLTRCVE